MKTVAASAAALALLALSVPATAQDFTINSGYALTSTYMEYGRPFGSPRASIQGYSEIETNGFYLGGAFASVRSGPDRLESELYAGYRNTVGALSYDLFYSRYFYNQTGNCCGEVTLALDYAAPFGMTFGTDLVYEHTNSFYVASVSAGYDFNTMVGVSAEFGRVESSHNFWNLGVTVTPMANTAIDLRYHDSDGDKDRLVGTLSYDFSLR
jgi:uncharacterized protein (TIGR02001 family)